jgi:hypothetical protein
MSEVSSERVKEFVTLFDGDVAAAQAALKRYEKENAKLPSRLSCFPTARRNYSFSPECL